MLPRFKNLQYINITVGHLFGLIDIIGSLQTQNVEIEKWFSVRHNLVRQFTVQSIHHTELLQLTLDNLYLMEQEFSDDFAALYKKQMKVLRNTWLVKLNAISISNMNVRKRMKEFNQLQEQEKSSEDSYSLYSSDREAGTHNLAHK